MTVDEHVITGRGDDVVIVRIDEIRQSQVQVRGQRRFAALCIDFFQSRVAAGIHIDPCSGRQVICERHIIVSIDIDPAIRSRDSRRPRNVNTSVNADVPTCGQRRACVNRAIGVHDNVPRDVDGAVNVHHAGRWNRLANE